MRGASTHGVSRAESTRGSRWPGAFLRAAQDSGFPSKHTAKTWEFDKIHILKRSPWLVCGEHTGRGKEKPRDGSLRRAESRRGSSPGVRRRQHQHHRGGRCSGRRCRPARPPAPASPTLAPSNSNSAVRWAARAPLRPGLCSCRPRGPALFSVFAVTFPASPSLTACVGVAHTHPDQLSTSTSLILFCAVPLIAIEHALSCIYLFSSPSV